MGGIPVHRRLTLCALILHLTQRAVLRTQQGIGYLAKLISAIEDHPFPLKLEPGTALQTFQCLAAYDDSLPKEFRELAAKATTDAHAREQFKELLLSQPDMHDLYAIRMSTTQAVDIVHGGVKVNALPERAVAIVNHRIADWRYYLHVVFLDAC